MQRRDSAQARGHANARYPPTRSRNLRRAVPPDVHDSLRPRDCFDPLLQCLRSRQDHVAVLRVISGSRLPAPKPPADDLRHGEPTRDFTYVANVFDACACVRSARASGNWSTSRRWRISLNQLFRRSRRGWRGTWNRPTRRSLGDVRIHSGHFQGPTAPGYQPIVSFEDGLKAPSSGTGPDRRRVSSSDLSRHPRRARGDAGGRAFLLNIRICSAHSASPRAPRDRRTAYHGQGWRS